MDGYLYVVLLRHCKAVVDAGRGGAPVFVEFQADGTCFYLQFQSFGQAGVAFAQKTDVHGQAVHRLQHFTHVPGTGGAGGCVGAGCRASAAAKHGGNATHKGFFHLLRADEMDVGVNTARSQYFAFAGDDFGAGAYNNVYAWLGVRVAGFADGGDAAFLQADVGFYDAPPIQNQGIGDHCVHHGIIGALALAHAIADDFAAAEFYFLTVVGVIFLNLNPQLGVAQPHAVAHGGAVHVGVGLPSYFHAIPHLLAWVQEQVGMTFQNTLLAAHPCDAWAPPSMAPHSFGKLIPPAPQT